jgi:hypothetical protein
MSNVNPYEIETLPIAELRRLASVHKIEYQKDWTKEQYVKAIQTRHRRFSVAKVVDDDKSEIPPGYVRIKLPLTPSGSDSPLSVQVNNFKTMIPRNILVDVPREIRDTIRGSTESVTRQRVDREGNKVLETIEVPCYPFEQHGESAGESGAIRPMGDMKNQSLREMWRDRYGKWPKNSDEAWKTFKMSYVNKANDKVIAEALASE